MKFRKGDNVIITTGSDRGKNGIISKIFEKTGKVAVEGINKKIKHMKGQEGRPGQKVEFFAPIDISNISIIDEKTGKPSKIGYKIEGKSKFRIARKSGEILITSTKSKKITKTKKTKETNKK